MKWNIGNKIGALIAFAIVAFISLGAVSYLMIKEFNSSVDWSTHTYKVLRTNEKLLSDIKDAETGQRGFIITGKEEYLDPFYAASISVYKTLDDLTQLTSDNPIQQNRLKTYKTLIDSKIEELNKSIDLRKNKGFDDAKNLVLAGIGKSIMDDFRQLAKTFEQEENNLLKMREATMASYASTTTTVILAGTLIAIISLLIAGFALVQNISKPLAVVTEVADQISKGDLSVKLKPSHRQDEIGLLNNVFLEMVIKLRASIQDIVEGINTLGSSSSEILAATTQVASGTSETSAAISQTTTTVEEVRQASQLSSQKAQQVAENASQISTVTMSGNQAVEKTGSLMEVIKDQVNVILQTTTTLSQQSQQIGGIIASVNEVADQSNLLAVNAAIEAAKAAEHGKGFAVVATEIKDLAQRSKEATFKVRSILSDIQKGIGAAVAATEQGNNAVAEGMIQSVQAGDSIRALAKSVEIAQHTASQIVASSQQQVVGMDQVALAMNNINQAGIENVASMRQAENAAKELNELGNKLKMLVDQYTM